jgi:hypothetical protein
MVFETIKDPEVRNIIRDASLTHRERISMLTKLREDARAEQRLASEAPAVDDDGLNSRLRDVELVLEELGKKPAEEEGKGPATL